MWKPAVDGRWRWAQPTGGGNTVSGFQYALSHVDDVRWATDMLSVAETSARYVAQVVVTDVPSVGMPSDEEWRPPWDSKTDLEVFKFCDPNARFF